MKKITILFFLFNVSLFAQKGWISGKLVLKNGSVLEGLMKKSKSSVSIKKNKNTKIYKYSEKQVDKAFFGTTDPNIDYYEFVNLYPRRNRLLRIVVNGKTKLYERTKSRICNRKIKERT